MRIPALLITLAGFFAACDHSNGVTGTPDGGGGGPLPGAACTQPNADPRCGQSCAVDGDCGGGLYCQVGKCTADCTAGPSGGCPVGKICSAVGKCEQDPSNPFGACAVESSQATIA